MNLSTTRATSCVLTALKITALLWPMSALPQPPAWTKEPDSFLGLRFDKPLEAQLPACEKGTVQMCYRNTSQKDRTILENVPDLGVPYEAKVTRFGHRISDVTITLEPLMAPHLLMVLEERYGAATTEATRKANPPHQPQESTTHRWMGKHVVVSFDSFTPMLGLAFLFVESLDTKKLRLAEADADIRKRASRR